MNRWRAENFQHSEAMLCDILVVNTVLCPKTTARTTPAVNPNANHGLRAVKFHSLQVRQHNNCTTLWRDAADGGMEAWVGPGDLWEISVPSIQLQFCNFSIQFQFQSKTSLKIKFIFKKKTLKGKKKKMVIKFRDTVEQ